MQIGKFIGISSTSVHGVLSEIFDMSKMGPKNADARALAEKR